MARDRVVPRCDLEVEPRGQHVLGQHLARAAGHRQRERDARDRAVLHALRARGAHERQAARLEVQHRLALRLAHQRLGAAARREADLDPARRVRRAEERLRPRRVVAVDEHRLGPVHRQRLGVRDEALHRRAGGSAAPRPRTASSRPAARSASRRGSRSRSAPRSATRRPSSRSPRSRARPPLPRPRQAAPDSPSGS